MPEAIAEHAPAKVNLALHVTGQRADGYHLLDTLAVFCEAGDRVLVEPATRDAFSIVGSFAKNLPADDRNLVMRARDLVRERVGEPPTPAVAITLQKNLPVASGIGGGSSDAAAAIRALKRLWGLALPESALANAALALGADVPMCLAAKTLRARGIGEILEEIRDMPALAIVLVNPGVAVPTPAVFRALPAKKNPPLPPLPRQLDFRALLEWLRQTRNDLEAPALSLAPPIGEALAGLEAQGAAFSRMSGSGATCFGLFTRHEDAARAAAALAAARPSWYVRATGTTERTDVDDAP